VVPAGLLDRGAEPGRGDRRADRRFQRARREDVISFSMK